MTKLTRKNFFILSAIFIVILLTGSHIAVNASSLEDQLREVQEDIARIRQERGSIQDQLNDLNSVAGDYYAKVNKLKQKVQNTQLDIEEKQLAIEELEISINILEEQILHKERIITARLEEITDLEKETDQSIREAYADFRLARPSGVSIFESENINEYFKASQYRQLLQKRINQTMQALIDQRQSLEYERKELEQQKVLLQQDREVLAEQKADLAKRKKAFQQDLDEYYAVLGVTQSQIADAQGRVAGLSVEEQLRQAQADRIQQEIFNSYNSPDPGSYVAKGTYIGQQGNTGLATGYHVHLMVHKNGVSRNPCSALPARFGNCGWGDALRWPLDGGFIFTSGYGSRCMPWGCSFHDAIDIAHPSAHAPVFAAHNGYIRRGVDSYGAKYVIICQNTNCNQGWKTGYWHLHSF